MSDEAEHPRLLVVEDEQIVAADLQVTLERLGYLVVAIVDSGRGAIDAAERLRPDLVLMDIQLKGAMDGIAAGDEIRQRCSIPVVFLTANGNEETWARARVTDPYGFVTKPFRAKHLNATIRVALNQHRLVTELFMEQAWLRVMLGSLSDGVIATDADGSVRYMNPAGEQLTGRPLSDSLGKPVEDVHALTTLQNQPLEQHPLRKALASEAPVRKDRFLLPAAHQSVGETPVEVSAAPILRGGRVVGAVTVFVDITDRVRRELEQEAERDRLEDQVLETTKALGNTRAELRALSGHLITAQEHERRRIARELHDDLSQRAAVIEMDIERLAPFVQSTEGKATLATVRGHVGKLSAGLRDVSHRLHPSIITDLGLPAALRELVEEFNDAGGEASFVERNAPSALSHEIGTALYRIAQEALRNAMKHARGAPVEIELAGKDNELHLSVEDAGPGFNLETVRGKHGLGLVSMLERARLVGGVLSVRTRPGDGTQIHVRVLHVNRATSG